MNNELVDKLLQDLETRADQKCWLCAAVTEPPKNYSPNICLDCLPEYRERSFVFVRPTQDEMEKLFSTNKGMTCR